MRLLFKVLLFPVTLALSLVIGVCRFVCDCFGAVMSVIATLMFVLAALTLILLKDSGGALTTAAIAFVLSPYGLPKLAEWFLDRLDDVNHALRSI